MMLDPQKLADALGDMNRSTRSQYHLTLETAIKELGALELDRLVTFDWNGLSPYMENSYRGYYSDLALDWLPLGHTCTVETLLRRLKGAVDNTYEGYKGGDNFMDGKTPLWASQYGTSSDSRAIMSIQLRGDQVIIVTKAID